MQAGPAVALTSGVGSSSIRQPVVFSAPNFPLPMETSHTAATVGLTPGDSSSSSSSSSSNFAEVSLDDLLHGNGTSDDDTFDQFFSSLQHCQQAGVAKQHDGFYDKCQQQQHQQQQQMIPVSTVVKQEKETGFFDEWSHQHQHQQAMDRCSPEDQKRYESSLIKEELSCKLQLKMMKEGKDFSAEVDDQATRKDYPISEETLKLQQLRREKNREAAKKCRQKKKLTEKQLEQKVRDSEREKRQMQQQLRQSTEDFASVLHSCCHSLPCFIAYLRQNRQVLRSPLLNAELQQFVKASGGQLSDCSSLYCCRGGGGGGGGTGGLQAASAESCGIEQ